MKPRSLFGEITGHDAAKYATEHVENMLNRLKSGPLPAPVETHLQVGELPIADSGRYDQLRTEVIDHA